MPKEEVAQVRSIEEARAKKPRAPRRCDQLRVAAATSFTAQEVDALAALGAILSQPSMLRAIQQMHSVATLDPHEAQTLDELLAVVSRGGDARVLVRSQAKAISALRGKAVKLRASASDAAATSRALGILAALIEKQHTSKTAHGCNRVEEKTAVDTILGKIASLQRAIANAKARRQIALAEEEALKSG